SEMNVPSPPAEGGVGRPVGEELEEDVGKRGGGGEDEEAAVGAPDDPVGDAAEVEGEDEDAAVAEGGVERAVGEVAREGGVVLQSVVGAPGQDDLPVRQ